MGVSVELHRTRTTATARAVSTRVIAALAPTSGSVPP